MTAKLKFTLGFLAVIALLTVFRVGSIFYGNIKGSETANISNYLTKPGSTKTNALTVDSDHDGLPDRDEILYSTNPYKSDTDGDSYLDGEEVTTGHDPLDPDSNDKTGPGDTSLSKNPNLTDRIADLTVASLVGDDGELDPSKATSETIDSIAQGIQLQAALSLFVEPVKDSDLSVSDDNSNPAVKKYLETILPIIESNILSPLQGSANNQSSLDSFFSDYKKAYQALMLIEVPSSWKNIHKDTLNLLQTIIKASDSLTDQAINEDPLKASYALQQLKDTFAKFHTVLISATKLAKSQSISTNDPLFELLK